MKSVRYYSYLKGNPVKHKWIDIDESGIHVFDFRFKNLLIPFSSVRKLRIDSNNTLFIHLYEGTHEYETNYIEMRFPSRDMAEEAFKTINARLGTSYAPKHSLKTLFVTVAIIFFLVCVIASFSTCSGNSNGVDTQTCRVCHRTYEAGTNGYRSIARRGMCESCYSNYEFGEQARDAAETYRNSKS